MSLLGSGTISLCGGMESDAYYLKGNFVENVLTHVLPKLTSFQILQTSKCQANIIFLIWRFSSEYLLHFSAKSRSIVSSPPRASQSEIVHVPEGHSMVFSTHLTTTAVSSNELVKKPQAIRITLLIPLHNHGHLSIT